MTEVYHFTGRIVPCPICRAVPMTVNGMLHPDLRVEVLDRLTPDGVDGEVIRDGNEVTMIGIRMTVHTYNCTELKSED